MAARLEAAPLLAEFAARLLVLAVTQEQRAQLLGIGPGRIKENTAAPGRNQEIKWEGWYETTTQVVVVGIDVNLTWT